jgi:Skp family chaperone for outer membrane proteins
MSQNNATPLYAVAGAADLAVAALRGLPAHAPVVAQRAEIFGGQVRERLTELPADLQKLRAELPTDVQKLRAELPTDVQKLRSDLPTLMQDFPAKVKKYAAELAGDLSEIYAELAARGEEAVGRFRREHAGTVDTVAETVADAAEKAADAADRVADEIADAPKSARTRGTAAS